MPLTRMHALDREAERFETPCGDGTMVWRRWGSGPPVVMLHGGSGSWTHWIRNIPALSREFEVWAGDVPGLGDSALPHAPHVPRSCADAVVEGIRRLFPLGGAKPRLVCFSFGCHIGTLAAPQLIDHLSDIVIIGTAALGLAPPHIRPLPKERSTMTAAERRDIHRQVLEALMFHDPANIDEEAIELQAINIAKARFRSREFAGSDDVRRGIAAVPLPLASIWGRHDVVANPDVETCLAALGEHHPELKAHIIPDAGHWVMYEQPAAFNAALLDVLQE